ncbi:hypothetical protein [Streptomyces turgidiscabies]|uniref:Uncharacterized protein n=1 Tax=Streptomyces turgidiscabies TaxID=85558 RepID=A0ABU0RXB5_9ACTN|nr:hypothetical protein [Streptomyces turgidiscabies]MDQ0936622.1 hypothetical protein [Streptomyces turgidiscabies]
MRPTSADGVPGVAEVAAAKPKAALVFGVGVPVGAMWERSHTSSHHCR